jgi:hypothetical protein
MQRYTVLRFVGCWVGAICTSWALVGCGGGAGSDGPSVEARAQSVQWGAAPTLLLSGTATVSATASSGLPVQYQSTTPAVCTVDTQTGVVSALAVGSCVITANQSGNSVYAPAAQSSLTLPVMVNPNQSITFDSAPTLTVFSIATVRATADSGLPVQFSSMTPAICSVHSTTGLVNALSAGVCVIAANQAGNAHFDAAIQVTQTIAVTVPGGVTVPGAPTAVLATAGDTAGTIVVKVGAVESGGSALVSYTVESLPAGINTTSATLPITVTCPGSCAGYALRVRAANGVGTGAASVATDVITNYDVVTRFYEPDTQPRDSIFIGTFTLNWTSRTVSNLRGRLSESMTGSLIAYPNDDMTWLNLDHQLSSISDGAGGLLVTTFKNNNTLTFTTNPAFGGTDGWEPGSGFGLYADFPGANPGNAYARIYVNVDNPTATLTQAQIDNLAYADCAPGGMMGATCMTGTTIAGYGFVGTMSGYPVSQTITKRP